MRSRCVAIGMLAALGCGERTPGTTAEPARPVPAAPAAADDPVARYRADLELIAQPRPPGSPHWKVVQDHCATGLEASGFTVRRAAYGTGVNVIGERRGETRPDEIVLLGAHYDSVADCPGADDNASGVAGVLAAARALGRGRFARTLQIACWDEEERGLVGSEAHARELAAAGVRPASVTVLEMIGFRSSAPDSQAVPAGFDVAFATAIGRLRDNQMRGDFIALVHDSGTRAAATAMARHAAALELPAMPLEIPDAAKSSPLLRDIRRSDHASFWDTGVPAVMVTDTANFRNAHYHCGAAPDQASDLDLTFASRVSAAVAAGLRDELEPLD
ncbi:MAG TPA: M28 family peptidase [Kofleriaceae bacterium]|nr:M28 family peptidase [Kofleriaceae bacterium]